MEQIFENKDLRLSLTGHDYDFVGVIEVKGKKPLTFFFDETTDDEGCVNEDATTFKGVYKDVEPYDETSGDGYDHAEEIATNIGANNWFTADPKDEWAGFLADCTERGWFLALVKAYCPKKLKKVEQTIR